MYCLYYGNISKLFIVRLYPSFSKVGSLVVRRLILTSRIRGFELGHVCTNDYDYLVQHIKCRGDCYTCSGRSIFQFRAERKGTARGQT